MEGVSKEQVKDFIKNMTLMDAAALVKELEAELGVSAASMGRLSRLRKRSPRPRPRRSRKSSRSRAPKSRSSKSISGSPVGFLFLDR
jgi:ribosomal L7/L12-like protein